MTDFTSILSGIANSSIPEAEKQKIMRATENKAVITYMKKLESALLPYPNSRDTAFIAAALKAHYDAMYLLMDPAAQKYTDHLNGEMRKNLKVVNISVDVGALIKSLQEEQEE